MKPLRPRSQTAQPAADRVAVPLLTVPTLPTLVRFALPNMGGMLATALAAIAETTYVGRSAWPRVLSERARCPSSARDRGPVVALTAMAKSNVAI